MKILLFLLQLIAAYCIVTGVVAMCLLGWAFAEKAYKDSVQHQMLEQVTK